MLYDKSKSDRLSSELWNSPSAEYRGAPFWAWNSRLDPEKLREQIGIFEEMGFGGFNMHVRQGLETEYLGEDFFGAIGACVDEAEKRGMLAWLYDEDRWPSGVAGGFVTKTKKYRIKALSSTKEKLQGSVKSVEEAEETIAPVFLAAFSLNFDKKGRLVSYTRVDEDEECENKNYYYIVTARGKEPRYNYQTYADTLWKPAIDRFVEITHEEYFGRFGDKFGKSIPAIFTDEPQTNPCNVPESAYDKKRCNTAWTWDFAETFKAAYGFDITDRLPEIFYKTADSSDSSVKYYYKRHLAERFNEAFLDNIGEWCDKHGIMSTGHLMCEDTLLDQTFRSFDSMRGYKNMQLPGIDILFDRRYFMTAKQCESVVRQMGKEGMLSEMYGVTGWDFDFRGHKSQGDWQACLGVTVRVPHLSWQTMKGEGKRDYPASIFYQSPWYKKYKLLEDHYARLNTVLTRGRAKTNVAVLHPIESFWMHYGSKAECSAEYNELDAQFVETCNWLLLSSFNFDYISESLLPELCKNPSCPLKVGNMEYDTVLLDNCETLRDTTLAALIKFADNGGKVIISGRRPHMILGKENRATDTLVEKATVVAHSKYDIVSALEPSRRVSIRIKNGPPTEDVLHTHRQDGNTEWIFVCKAYRPELSHIPSARICELEAEGLFRAKIYDTLSGEILPVTYSAKNGRTVVSFKMFDDDSFLFSLEGIDCEESFTAPSAEWERSDMPAPSRCAYRLEEPNCLLLDMPQWSLDDGALQPREELMRIDEAVRTKLGLALKRTKCVQPWVVPDAPEENKLYLRFTFESRIDYDGAMLALENLEKSIVAFNGKAVDTEPVGYFVDKEIHTCRLPEIRTGENVLEITMPFGLRTDAENCFILGAFGTAYAGRDAYITALPEKLAFGDAVHQGLAFYGANLVYDTEVELDEESALEVEVSHYRGALVELLVDGVPTADIWRSPFRAVTDKLSVGKHVLSYRLYGNRYNTFSALHNLLADKKGVYIGPDYWRTAGFEWAYEYNTRPMGILKTPVVRKIKRKEA